MIVYTLILEGAVQTWMFLKHLIDFFENMCFKWGLKEEDSNASIGISNDFVYP